MSLSRIQALRRPVRGSILAIQCSSPIQPVIQPTNNPICQNLAQLPLKQRNPHKHIQSHRSYYTANSAPADPFPPTETAILAAAFHHVPQHGFTNHALTLGAVDAGYLPASTNLFPRGAFDLVMYHLVTSRLALKDSVQFPTTEAEKVSSLTINEKVRSVLIARLKANESILHRLPEALGLMSLAGNIPASLRELALLVDEILYLAGDIDVSASWYTKRAALAGVYASSELYMTQDSSTGFVETEQFADRRLQESENLGYALNSTGEWLSFTGLSAVNVLRSWGAKI